MPISYPKLRDRNPPRLPEDVPVEWRLKFLSCLNTMDQRTLRLEQCLYGMLKELAADNPAHDLPEDYREYLACRDLRREVEAALSALDRQVTEPLMKAWCAGH